MESDSLRTGKDYVEWLKDKLMEKEITHEPGKALWKDGLNPHVIRHMVFYAVATVAFGIMWLFALWAFPSLSPDDPDILIRILLEKGVKCGPYYVILHGGLLFREIIGNGNALGKILQHPVAVAVDNAAYMFCITFIYYVM